MRSPRSAKRNSRGCLARFTGLLPILLCVAGSVWLLPKLFPQVSDAGWGLGMFAALLIIGAVLRATDSPQERARARAQERQWRTEDAQRAEAEWRERREAEEREKRLK